MTTEEKTKEKNIRVTKKPARQKGPKPKIQPNLSQPNLAMSKSELEIELRGLLAMAKSKENLSSAVAILKLIRELEANEQASSLKAHWLDELMGMSDADLERRIRQELEQFKTG